MFSNNSVPYSVPVAPISSGNNGGMFGGDDGILGILLIIALLGGFGNGGFGGGFGGGGAQRDYVLATDFATIERKLDGVNAGICDSTFALNNTIQTGFFGVQNAMCQGFNGLNTSIMSGNNAIQAQLAECCCGTQRAIDGVNYNLATQSCDTRNVIQTVIRDLIDNQNANYRALHDEIVANRIEDKNAQIASLTAQLQRADLMASQAKQNAYLLSELKPCPIPSYPVPNPNCCYNASVTFANPYGGCGCGCA